MVYKGTHDIAGVPVAACDFEFILSKTEKHIRQGKMFLVSPIASQTIAKARTDPRLRQTLHRFNHLVPDGYWVKKALEWIHGIRLEKRVYGPLLTEKLLALAERNGYGIAFYGTTPKTLRSLRNKLHKKYPRLKLKTCIPSLFRPLTEQELQELIATLNASGIQILFIALGSPMQEIFADRLTSCKAPRLRPCAVFTVGAAVDFISGVKRQAPSQMGEAGFEWLFRLFQEPGRMWKRYLWHGPQFLLQVVQDIKKKCAK